MSRRNQLRQATQHQHATLDGLVAKRRSFDSVNAYRQWLSSALGFHQEMHRLLSCSQSAAELPLEALTERKVLIERDMMDLAQTLPVFDEPEMSARLSDLEALGTLYVTEGASLGARVLLLKAKQLGLSETHGARHLAYSAHQLRHWQDVLERLETCQCHPDEEHLMIAAAQKAFEIALTHWGHS